MVVGVMRILVLTKFLNVKFISVKIGDPITSTVTIEADWGQHMSKYVHMFDTSNIGPDMFICCLFPTYGQT
jgi:hypothetical protein